MGQKWPDATVRSHAVIIAWNEVHHWNGIENSVIAVWLSCYIILCIISKGRFDVISRIFPAAQRPRHLDVVLLGTGNCRDQFWADPGLHTAIPGTSVHYSYHQGRIFNVIPMVLLTWYSKNILERYSCILALALPSKWPFQINWAYTTLKAYYALHWLYCQDRIFDAVLMVHSILR